VLAHRVVLTALGLSSSDVDVPVPSDRADRPWVPVGSDATTRIRAEAVLDAVAAAGADGRESPALRGTDGVQRQMQPVRADALRERLPDSTAVVLASPVLDDEPVELVEALSAADHSVLVVSPDVTDSETPGSRVAAVERRVRIERLRTGVARVVDWGVTDPLSVAMEGPA